MPAEDGLLLSTHGCLGLESLLQQRKGAWRALHLRGSPHTHKGLGAESRHAVTATVGSGSAHGKIPPLGMQGAEPAAAQHSLGLWSRSGKWTFREEEGEWEINADSLPRTFQKRWGENGFIWGICVQLWVFRYTASFCSHSVLAPWQHQGFDTEASLDCDIVEVGFGFT